MNTLARVKLTDLLYRLEAFAEHCPTKREIFVKRLTEMRAAGLSNSEIGARLGKTRNCIGVWVFNLHLPRRAA